MTPKQFHKMCHEAILQCPQFRGYKDTDVFDDYGKFGKIPKQGWLKVISFWKQEELLWEYGYSRHLPSEMLNMFDCLDDVINSAISDFIKSHKFK